MHDSPDARRASSHRCPASGSPGASWRMPTALILLLTVASCVPIPVGPGGAPLAARAETLTPEVFEGSAAALGARVEGGSAPYRFRWNVNASPGPIDLPDATESDIITPVLDTPGRYVFRVRVTDDAGRVATAFVTVDVLAAFTVDAPSLAVAGDPVTLSVTLSEAIAEADFLWEVVSGSGVLSAPTTNETQFTTERGETVVVRLTVSLPGVEGATSDLTRDIEIIAIETLRPEVVIETSLGDIVFELDAAAAPGHVVNFLAYVDSGFYEGLLFHRAACTEDPETETCDPFVLQGGGFRREGEEIELVEPTREGVVSEAPNGLSNATLYSVSLALAGNNPDSGRTQFFINLTDNGHLDDRGFTVFAMVIEGFATIDAIMALERLESPVIAGEVSLPAEDVIILRMARRPAAP